MANDMLDHRLVVYLAQIIELGLQPCPYLVVIREATTFSQALLHGEAIVQRVDHITHDRLGLANHIGGVFVTRQQAMIQE